MTATVHSITEGRTQSNEQNLRDRVTVTTRSTDTVTGDASLTVRSSFTGQAIPIEALYPEEDAASPALASALRTISAALKLVQQSIAASRNGDPLQADSEMLQVGTILPQIFCSRSLGDGFGSVVNALMLSFRNQKGQPFTLKQTQAILRVLGQLKQQPFLSLESSLDQLVELQSTGLRVYPAELSGFSDIVADE